MPPEKVPIGIRRVVVARAGGYCEYCRCLERFATESFTVEHIIPRVITPKLHGYQARGEGQRAMGYGHKKAILPTGRLAPTPQSASLKGVCKKLSHCNQVITCDGSTKFWLEREGRFN